MGDRTIAALRGNIKDRETAVGFGNLRQVYPHTQVLLSWSATSSSRPDNVQTSAKAGSKLFKEPRTGERFDLDLT